MSQHRPGLRGKNQLFVVPKSNHPRIWAQKAEVISYETFNLPKMEQYKYTYPSKCYCKCDMRSSTHFFHLQEVAKIIVSLYSEGRSVLEDNMDCMKGAAWEELMK